jgi:peptidoglycan/LPS O-acetylase OafA/YrhL
MPNPEPKVAYGLLTLTMALLFVAGSGLYRLAERLRPSAAWDGAAFSAIATMIAAAFVSQAFLYPNEVALYHGQYLPLSAAALLVLSLYLSCGVAAFLFGNPVARYLGETSYCLYMSHIPVVPLLRHLAGSDILSLPLELLVAQAVASLLHYLIEKPAREGIRSLAFPDHAIIIGGGVVEIPLMTLRQPPLFGAVGYQPVNVTALIRGWSRAAQGAPMMCR